MVITKKAVEDDLLTWKIGKLLINLKIPYVDIKKYILAFIHRSIVNERQDFAPEHNERLEFLWDAVLELVITDNLFRDYKEKPEWELTDIRSAIVRGKNLAKITRKLGLNEYLILWKWEEKWWWRENDYLLANTMEAFIWALYLDLWINYAKNFIDRYIYSTIEEIFENDLVKDYKTLVQEVSQSKYNVTPKYEVLDENWPDHNKVFKVWIFLGSKLMWTWIWKSKKRAEESAAEEAYGKVK
jgi:ribonuclease III